MNPDCSCFRRIVRMYTFAIRASSCGSSNTISLDTRSSSQYQGETPEKKYTTGLAAAQAHRRPCRAQHPKALILRRPMCNRRRSAGVVVASACVEVLFDSGRIFVNVENNDSLSLTRSSPNNYFCLLRKRLRNLRSGFDGVRAVVANIMRLLLWFFSGCSYCTSLRAIPMLLLALLRVEMLCR